jgi:hypothetical protein
MRAGSMSPDIRRAGDPDLVRIAYLFGAAEKTGAEIQQGRQQRRTPPVDVKKHRLLRRLQSTRHRVRERSVSGRACAIHVLSHSARVYLGFSPETSVVFGAVALLLKKTCDDPNSALWRGSNQEGSWCTCWLLCPSMLALRRHLLYRNYLYTACFSFDACSGVW